MRYTGSKLGIVRKNMPTLIQETDRLVNTVFTFSGKRTHMHLSNDTNAVMNPVTRMKYTCGYPAVKLWISRGRKGKSADTKPRINTNKKPLREEQRSQVCYRQRDQADVDRVSKAVVDEDDDVDDVAC